MSIPFLVQGAQNCRWSARIKQRFCDPSTPTHPLSPEASLSVNWGQYNKTVWKCNEYHCAFHSDVPGPIRGGIIGHVLQSKKMRLREIKWTAQVHTANKRSHSKTCAVTSYTEEPFESAKRQSLSSEQWFFPLLTDHPSGQLRSISIRASDPAIHSFSYCTVSCRHPKDWKRNCTGLQRSRPGWRNCPQGPAVPGIMLFILVSSLSLRPCLSFSLSISPFFSLSPLPSTPFLSLRLQAWFLLFGWDDKIQRISSVNFNIQVYLTLSSEDLQEFLPLGNATI